MHYWIFLVPFFIKYLNGSSYNVVNSTAKKKLITKTTTDKYKMFS